MTRVDSARKEVRDILLFLEMEGVKEISEGDLNCKYAKREGKNKALFQEGGMKII